MYYELDASNTNSPYSAMYIVYSACTLSIDVSRIGGGMTRGYHMSGNSRGT